MERVFIIFLFLFGGLSLAAEPPSPLSLSEQTQRALKLVRPACVAVFAGGHGSGVIISPEGHVLTAAHILKELHKKQQTVVLTLADGRTLNASVLGFNLESDIGLLQIKDHKKAQFNHCTVAKNSPATGDFLFTYAHPAGQIKGRPAQLRLGRITSVKKRDGIPLSLFSDLNIQPGDSGGPVFSLQGKLVGMNSCAASYIDFNIFAAIEQLHQDWQKLLKGRRWGDPKLAPTRDQMFTATFDQKAIGKIHEELLRRTKAHHFKTTDFVRKFVGDNGEAKIDAAKMISFMAKDAISIANGDAVSLGTDDPAIVSQLGAKPAGFIAYHISDGNKTVCKATAINKRLLVAKASLLEKVTNPQLKLRSASYPLSVVGTSKAYDLVLLRLPKPLEHPHTSFPPATIDIEAGTPLMAPDKYGRPLWNIATDQRRDVKTKLATGPLKDKSKISKRRSSLPAVVRHSLALYAQDAGTPMFDLNGDFVGIHIARLSRTMGLMVPHEHIKSFVVTQTNKEKK